MGYSGAGEARSVRESLGEALAALQQDPNLPEDVMAVASNVASAVNSLFEAERASTELDGKAATKAALGSLSQTLALLQDVSADHPGVSRASQVIAQAMSTLYPLTTVPSRAPSVPSPGSGAPPGQTVPKAAPVPAAPAQPRTQLEANIGATTESNFFVGFSGEIAEGGVFLGTYEVLPQGTPIDLLVTLPGGFETRIDGFVWFVRDPLDLASEAHPGMGIKFERLQSDQRELILRFIRKRAPMFYDE
ncbi:MAG TPA: hypothetical protein RMF84_14355 [Polyangiaceae bacterium LLY-WYZ-14_1]|jgi:uncharacterized protein (TIGR02266 family)|nr:hypothetical protein [Polyangiaceae bacterium LLY-WYZ-14_1]